MAKVMATALGLQAGQAGGGPAWRDAASIPGWAAPYIAAAAKAKILTGYPDGSFRPNATVTEAEVLAMLVRALGASGYVSQLDQQGEQWPQDYVDAATHFNLVGPTPAVVPDQPATRLWTANVVWHAVSGIADFTVQAGGRTVVSTEGGIWARNLWTGTLPATIAGTVTSIGGGSVAISVLEDAYPAGGRIPRTATYPLAADVLLEGGYQGLSQVQPGDLVTLAVDPAGKVDFIQGSPGGGSPACPPTFTSQQVAQGMIMVPVQLVGPRATVSLMALADPSLPVTMIDAALLKQLGYQPTTQEISKPFFNNTQLTGATYSIDEPSAWSADLWYNIGQQKTAVVGVQDFAARFGGWRVALGDPILRPYNISINGQTWTVTPPCAAGGK